MAQNSNWMKLVGTQVGHFILGLAGVRLKNNAGGLHVRKNADDGFAPVTAETVGIQNNAAGAAPTVLKTSPAQVDPLQLVFPPDIGAPGDVLATDGAGNLSWEPAGGSTSMKWSADSTLLGFGSTAVVPMFALPIGAQIDRVDVIVDVAFDGAAAQMSVGVNGASASKYVAAADVDLKKVGRYTIPSTELPVAGAPEALEIAYSASGSTIGSARTIVTHTTPS